MLITLILVFLLLSALFSGSEIAFISANKLKIELLKNKGKRRGTILAGFYEKPTNFLSTMLVGNNIALVAFSLFMGKIISPFFQPHLGEGLAMVLANTILITIIILIFGEFIPKTLFRLYANEAIYNLAYPLRIVQFILFVPSYIMITLSNSLLSYIFKLPLEETASAFTRLDLENLVNSSRQMDDEEEIDKELFGKALNLKDVKVKDCMVPRTEIEHIDVSTGVEGLIQVIERTKLSRIIITEGDIDEVLGYIHHQQLLEKPQTLKELILDIQFIPEVMKVGDVLGRFIKENVNIACVVDEFGAIAGIVTLEDLLEEIFGEIEDEYDQQENVERQIADEEFIFSGRLEIDYLNEKYNAIRLPDGEYHTLSGYLVMTLEKIPQEGSEVILDGYKFTPEVVSDTKIELIRVQKVPENVED